MDKAKILEEFIEFAKDRHEKGKCDCKKREGVGNCDEEQQELDSDELQQLKSIFEDVTKKEVSGFILAKSGDKTRMCVCQMSRFEIMVVLISALRVVLRGVTRIEAVEFLTNILAEILRETGKGAMRDELVGTVKNVIDDIVYGEND